MIGRHAPGPWRLLATAATLPGPPIATAPFLAALDDRFNLRLSARAARLAARLAIDTRHFCRDFAALGEPPRPHHANPQLAAQAVADALHAADLRPSSLAYLLAHTTTPHTLLPSNVAWVADLLPFHGPFAELRQACAGFAHALQFAGALLRSQDDPPVAIVGSETGSVFLDPRRAARDIEQLLNLVQMGDGAGAAILAPDRPGPFPRIRDAFVGSLGPGLDPGFWLESGGSAHPVVDGIPHFRHDASSVRANGPRLFQAALEAVSSLAIRLDDFDWFLPHQANAAELPLELARLLAVPLERILVSADRVGNLGSASIWVGLHLARSSGLLKPGHRVLVLGAEATKYLFGGFVYEHA